jgi:DNA-binding NarL/FixJ family response regulator
MMKSIRITLADDHPVVLAGMKALLEAVNDFTIVGEASDGRRAMEIIDEKKPDIAVLDISLPIIGGIELAQRISADFPGVRLLALTVHEDRAYVQPMMQAGARGYLLKRSAAEELVRAIRAIADGGVYLDPAIAEKALPSAPGEHATTARGTHLELTPRETEVLRLIARGFSNKEIAARLEVSVKTVETHKSRGVEKLGLFTRADIVRYAASQGWLDQILKD